MSYRKIRHRYKKSNNHNDILQRFASKLNKAMKSQDNPIIIHLDHKQYDRSKRQSLFDQLTKCILPIFVKQKDNVGSKITVKNKQYFYQYIRINASKQILFCFAGNCAKAVCVINTVNTLEITGHSFKKILLGLSRENVVFYDDIDFVIKYFQIRIAKTIISQQQSASIKNVSMFDIYPEKHRKMLLNLGYIRSATKYIPQCITKLITSYYGKYSSSPPSLPGTVSFSARYALIEDIFIIDHNLCHGHKYSLNAEFTMIFSRCKGYVRFGIVEQSEALTKLCVGNKQKKIMNRNSANSYTLREFGYPEWRSMEKIELSIDLNNCKEVTLQSIVKGIKKPNPKQKRRSYVEHRAMVPRPHRSMIKPVKKKVFIVEENKTYRPFIAFRSNVTVEFAFSVSTQ
eukprot:240987_1